VAGEPAFGEAGEFASASASALARLVFKPRRPERSEGRLFGFAVAVALGVEASAITLPLASTTRL
jgi:hypothetical protein